MDIHTCVGCEPSFIGSHVVDGAINASNLIEFIRLSTRDERSGIIFSEKCDARQINMTGTKIKMYDNVRKESH